MSSESLRDQVLELEPYPGDLKDSIREKILHTRERPLKAWERLQMALAGMSVGLMLLGLTTWVILDSERFIQLPMRILVGISLVPPLLFYMLILSYRNLRKGTMRQLQATYLAYGAFGFMIVMVVGEILFEPDASNSAIAALIIIGVLVICAYTESAELRLRERLLRNELALAELTELISGEENSRVERD